MSNHPLVGTTPSQILLRLVSRLGTSVKTQTLKWFESVPKIKGNLATFSFPIANGNTRTTPIPINLFSLAIPKLSQLDSPNLVFKVNFSCRF